MVWNIATMVTKVESLSFQTVTNTTSLWRIGQSGAVRKCNHDLLLMTDFCPTLTVTLDKTLSGYEMTSVQHSVT